MKEPRTVQHSKPFFLTLTYYLKALCCSVLTKIPQDNRYNYSPTPSTLRCASIPSLRAGKTKTYHCDGGSMDGRFVNVIIPGDSKTLTLCEVEVYGTLAGATITDRL